MKYNKTLNNIQKEVTLKIVKKILRKFGFILILLLFIWSVIPTWTPGIKGNNSISTLEEIEINSSKQTVMIRGENKNHPVIIFVHGGPGCSEIPYVRKYQKELEKYFTIVHYDQRGSGKSYHFFEDNSVKNSTVLVEDLLQLTDIILEQLNKEKVILIGHSYGTYIAIQAAEKAPEKFSAYLGIGQMSDLKIAEMDSLKYCFERAKKAGADKDVKALEELKREVEQGTQILPRKYIRKYDGAARNIDENKDILLGFIQNREYNLLDIIGYYRGIMKSQDALIHEAMQKPINEIVTSLDIPCYFLMGKYDYMTSTNAAKLYFNTLKADHKEFITYENSAHYPQFEENEKFVKWMINTFYK